MVLSALIERDSTLAPEEEIFFDSALARVAFQKAKSLRKIIEHLHHHATSVDEEGYLHLNGDVSTGFCTGESPVFDAIAIRDSSDLIINIMTNYQSEYAYIEHCLVCLMQEDTRFGPDRQAWAEWIHLQREQLKLTCEGHKSFLPVWIAAREGDEMYMDKVMIFAFENDEKDDGEALFTYDWIPDPEKEYVQKAFEMLTVLPEV